MDQSPHSHTLAFYLRGASQNDTDLYVMINASPDYTTFHIQQEGTWKRVVDTSLASPDDIAEAGHETHIDGADYLVRGRSVAVFTR